MKFDNFSAHQAGNTASYRKPVSFLLVILLSFSASSQAVTEIITDFNGYWKSATATHPIKPNNSHNLLAFTHNGIRYSTGVNDELLSSNGESFVQSDFWSMPVSDISGAPTANTKVGLGAMYDGVSNGPSNPSPAAGIAQYLTDGVKGLNIGTCIANLPAGNMTFLIQNIQPSSIGDGVPDVLVTQIADPSGSSFDRYELVNSNGVRVGNYKDIVFTNIPVVGMWTADFYNANSNPMVLQAGFTQTDRPYRLWAADLSEFGINASNYAQVTGFKINLCGNSDVAFVAYNNKSLSFQQPLPIRFHDFKAGAFANGVELKWKTSGEEETIDYTVEKMKAGGSFESIGTVKAKKNSPLNTYSFIDGSTTSGTVYYRIRQNDVKGSAIYSATVKVDLLPAISFFIYPNPAREAVTIQHDALRQDEETGLYDQTGRLVRQVIAKKGNKQTLISLHGLIKGNYVIRMGTGSMNLVVW